MVREIEAEGKVEEDRGGAQGRGERERERP
jgi:hypothetical protein